MKKTNVMRLLEAAGIPYTEKSFPVDEADLSAEHAARALGLPSGQVFKTIVLMEDRAGRFVCCIPAGRAIDLRKAARAMGGKRAGLLPAGDLLSATGYLRGGCSPIGMKRKYPLFLDETCALHEAIAVSAGERGRMVLLAPQALIRYTGAQAADLVQ